MKTAYDRMLEYKKTLHLERKSNEQKIADAAVFISNLRSLKDLNRSSMLNEYKQIRKGFIDEK